MISIAQLIGILLVHWVADFVLQTDEQAQGKSKNFRALVSHTYTYSLVILFSYLIYLHSVDPMGPWNVEKGVMAFCVTLICHTVQDFFTSRLNSRLWEQKRTHDFFVSIGFDQVLHYVQLFLTFIYLQNL